MSIVYFRTGASPSVFRLSCISDGRIDFSLLAQKFKWDPASIELNGILFPKEGLKSEKLWEQIKADFEELGEPLERKGDPVIVSGQPTGLKDDKFRSRSEVMLLKELPELPQDEVVLRNILFPNENGRPPVTEEVYSYFRAVFAELLQEHRRHKTAFTSEIPVEVATDTTLSKYEVEGKDVPCTTGPVDTLLDPERALLADLRYLHLLHIARRKSVKDIVGMKRKRNRRQHDLERVYYGHALAIMKASTEGQPEISVVAEDHTAGDGARGDLRVYVRDKEHPSEMKAVNGSSNASTDETGISKNKATFGKLHNIIRTKLLKPGAGGTFLCTFLNRIECIWFAKFEYDSKDRLISCQVAPEIPAKGLKPSAQICPLLDSILEDHPEDKNVMLADLLDLKAPFGFRCLTRYMDTLCRMNDVPIIPVAFMTKDETYLDMEQARIVARGMKSLIIQVGEEDVVLKVGPLKSIQNEVQNHSLVDGRAPNIRVMDQGVHGSVKGVEGLAFIKLKGFGRCISSISWAQLAEFWIAMEKALSGLHACSLLHRNIKPDNMLLIDEQPVLNDFDISCRADDSVQLQKYIGTPAFRSPYWTKGKLYVLADDWVSLGLSFSSLLSLSLLRVDDPLRGLIDDPRTPDPLRGLIDDPRTPQDMKDKLSAAIEHAQARDQVFLNSIRKM